MVTSIEKKKLKVWQIVLIVIGGLFLLGIIFGNSSKENEIQNNPLNSNTIDSNKDIQNSNSASSEETSYSSKSKEKLTILSSEIEYGEYGTLSIVGTAKNTAGEDLTYCQISAKFYDSDNAVIGTSLANINNLGDGESWKFEIMYFDMDTENVEDYKISDISCW